MAQHERDGRDLSRLLTEGDALRRDNDAMRYAVQQLAAAQRQAEDANERAAAQQGALDAARAELSGAALERDGAVQARDEMTAERNFFKRKAGTCPTASLHSPCVWRCGSWFGLYLFQNRWRTTSRNC